MPNLVQMTADFNQAIYDRFLAEQREMYGDTDEWAACIYAETAGEVFKAVLDEHLRPSPDQQSVTEGD